MLVTVEDLINVFLNNTNTKKDTGSTSSYKNNLLKDMDSKIADLKVLISAYETRAENIQTVLKNLRGELAEIELVKSKFE